MSAGKKLPAHKVIITGTGRAGTTFLVRLLTELGLDTGYTNQNWSRDYFPHCEAGLEHDLARPNLPYIIKNPALCDQLESILAAGTVTIDHAYIPIRELEAAAASRVRVGGANGNVPGGLLKTSDPSGQKAALAEMFHRLVLTLVAREIPHTFLLFPRFVCDADYAYSKLQFLVREIPLDDFRRTFARVADPALIHDFSRPENRSFNIGAESYFRNVEMQRQRRRARHAVRWALGVAAACLAMLYPAWRKLLLPPGPTAVPPPAALLPPHAR